MPRGPEQPEVPKTSGPKSRNESDETDIVVAGIQSPSEVPVLPPFLNRNTNYELPEYDGRRFPKNGNGHPSPLERNLSPDYYYDNDDFFRSVNTLPRATQAQNSQVTPVKNDAVSEANYVSDIIGIRDVCGNRKLWKMLIAEFIGTLFLVLVGCGTCIGGWTEGYQPNIVQIALAFGITVATLAQAIGHCSGANLNPAVTVGLLVCGKCSILKSLFYIGAQCLGAICGSAILQVITPVELQGNLGLTQVSEKLDTVQAVFVEALITFVLVLTVCGVCDELRKDIKGSAPLAIGLSITGCHLMAISYTGSSMNPARSFGPAVITKIWTNHWVYWAGPLAGGFIAGFLYNVAFQETAPKPTRIELKNGGDQYWIASKQESRA